MTLRRLWVLVSQLPPDSAIQTIAAQLPGNGLERAIWTPQMHLLAAIHDAVTGLRHSFDSANSKRPPKAPKPYPRPRSDKKET